MGSGMVSNSRNAHKEVEIMADLQRDRLLVLTSIGDALSPTSVANMLKAYGLVLDIEKHGR